MFEERTDIDFLVHPDSKKLIKLLEEDGSRIFNLSREVYTIEQRQALANQARLYKRAKNKLPNMYLAGCLFTQKSFEQASSESISMAMADYLGDLSGKKVLDLCGGLAVDALAFASKGAKVISFELDAILHKIRAYNLTKLSQQLGKEKLDISIIQGDGLKEFSLNWREYDLIYADPDRRTEEGGRMNDWAKSYPSGVELVGLSDKFQRPLFIKQSPLLHFESVITLHQSCSRVAYFSKNNEVKQTIFGFNLPLEPTPLAKLDYIEIEKKKRREFSLPYKPERRKEPLVKHDQKNLKEISYLVIPPSVIHASGQINEFADKFTLLRLSKSNKVLGSIIHPQCPGRILKVLDQINLQGLQKKLKEHSWKSATISTKGLNIEAAKLRKKLKLKESAKNYLVLVEGVKAESDVTCILATLITEHK